MSDSRHNREWLLRCENPEHWSCMKLARYWFRMSDEPAKFKLKIEQAEAAVARAQSVHDKAAPDSFRDSRLQLLLAKEKALEQLREEILVQRPAAAGVGDKHCLCFWDTWWCLFMLMS